MSNSALAVREREIGREVMRAMGPPPQRFAAATTGAISHAKVRQLVMAYRQARLAAVVPDFKLQPGMVYTKVRAISARINQNYDAWPSKELRKSYKTFLGKPCFVNHNNFDPGLARGRVVAARYIEKGADKYIEVIQETDGQRYPKLGTELKTGGLDSVSMGVEAGFTVCSYCNNRATDVFDMCDHVKFHKGSYLPDPQTGEPKLVYENCYKLGFFELSYVFDPADETAVVSQVVTAGRRRSWNETKAPEDIDTMDEQDTGKGDDDYAFVEPYRPNQEHDDNPFQHYLESPEELQEPDLGETQRLDRQQEDQGLDDSRKVEDVEEVGAPQDGGVSPERAATRRRKTMARSTRSRRVTAEDDAPPWLQDDDGGADQGDYAGPDGAEDDAGTDDAGEDDGYGDDGGGDFPPDDGGGDDGGEDQPTDDQLIDEAEADLEQARAQQHADDGGDLGADQGQPPDDDQGPPPGDDQGPPPDENGDLPPQFARRQRPRRAARRRYAEDDDKDKDDDDSDDEDDDDKDDDNKPPWLKEKESRRRAPVRKQVPAKKGRKKEGAAMGAPRLAERGRVATAGRRQHFADDNGYTDGGPYGVNEQAQPEEQINSVFGEGDGVPPAEEVAAPTGDGSKAPNSESNLVARIQKKTRSLQADIAAYNQLQARSKRGPQRGARRRTAEDVVEPDVVNPELSATDDQSIKGDDFQDTGLEDGTVHPTDGDSNNKIGRDQSRQWFAAFDNWLRQTTQRNWKQHNAQTLTRLAVRWSKNSGVPVNALMPTLQSALHQARKAEANRRGNVRRTAEDEALEVAAPDERTDPTTPTKNETDERAQSSQFDLGDFGHNAGDDLADPEMSSDSQIWAPGEGKRERSSSQKMAEGVAAVRCAEAYIKVGLAKSADKWKLAGWLQTMRADIVADRTNLLDAVYAQNHRAFTAARIPAGRMRGVQSVPPGFGRGGRVASTQRIAAEDPINDAAMWL